MIKEKILFERAVKYTFKNRVYFTILLFFEFLSIFLEAIQSGEKVLTSSAASFTEYKILYYMSYVDPYNLLKTTISCVSEDSQVCSLPANFAIIIGVVFFVVFASFIVNSYYLDVKMNDFDFGIRNKSNFQQFMIQTNYFYINFFDILIHIFGQCFLLIFSNLLLSAILRLFSSNDIYFEDSVAIICSLLIISYYLNFYLRHIKTINIMLQFNKELDYHYDSLFSKSYNYLLFILKIIIVVENNFTLNLSNLLKINFLLNLVIILTLIVFTMIKVIDVFTGKLIFLSNVEFNINRVCFLIFSSIILSILLVFGEEMKNTSIFVLTSISIMVFTFYCACYVKRLIYEGLSKNKSLIYQVIYVLNLKQIATDEDLRSEISNIFLIHKFNCSMDCRLCNQEDYSYQNFLSSYLKQINYEFKNKIVNYNKTELEYYILLKLIIIEQIESDKIVKLVYKIKAALDNVSKLKGSVYWNLIMFYAYIKARTPESIIKKFLIMKKYDECNTLFEKSLNKIDELYLIFNTHIDQEIYEVADTLAIYKNSIYDNIVLFDKIKNFYTENYTLLLLKYMYENFFNEKIKGMLNVSDEIGDMEEMMTFHYMNDYFIKINYHIENDTLYVYKASRELIDYNLKSFEDIFPNKFRKEAKRRFIKKIKENNSEKFFYEFIMKRSPNDIYVHFFKIECFVSLSMDLKELLILGDYNISKEDIIVFEEDENGKESLENFSRNVAKLLYISPLWLSRLKKSKFTLDFNLIFDKITTNNKYGLEDEGNGKGSSANSKYDNMNFYKLDYAKYYSYYSSVIEKLLVDVRQDNEEEEVLDLNELKTFAANKTCNSIALIKKLRIKNEKQRFNVYSVRKIDLQRLCNSNFNFDEQITGDIADYDNLMTEGLISSTNGSAESRSLNQAKVSNQRYLENENQNSRELGQITISTSILSVIFIIYSIIFFCMGLLNKNKLRDSFSVINSYNDMRSNFFDTSSSLLNNFELYEYDSTNITDNRKGFFDSLSKNSNITINFNQFIKYELLAKLDILEASVTTFQGAVMDSSLNDKVDFILNESIDYYRLSKIGNQISLQKKQYLFLDSVNMYISNAQIIAETNDISVFIYILTIANGEVDFSNIFDFNLSANQLYAYEIIMNYVLLYNKFQMLGKELLNIHLDNLTSIFNQTFYMSFILMGLHIFLIVLCYCIIRYLNRIIIRNNLIINDLFIFTNIRYMRTKVALFRNINELYREDPTKLINKFKKARNGYLMSRTGRKGTGHDTVQDNGLEIEIYQRDIENRIKTDGLVLLKNAKYYIDSMLLLKPIFFFISVLFLIYYIFSIVFYFVIESSKIEISSTTLAAQENIQIYNEILNMVNLLQVELFTNITDAELSKQIDANSTQPNQGYVFTMDNQALIDTFQMYSSNTISQKFGILQNYQTKLMSCNYIYTSMNDSIYYSMRKYYPDEKSFQESLTAICNMYSVMKNKNIQFITSELSYNVMALLFEYSNSNRTYSEIKQIYDLRSRYDLYIILTIILRPIQTYINLNLNTFSSTMSENYYLQINVIYLSLSIFLDCVIYLAINEKIVKKVIKINKNLTNFINIIKK